MTIYTPWNDGLGDTIATISLLARRAHLTGRGPIHLARRNRGRLHDELFGARGVLVSTDLYSVEGDGDTPLSGFDVWAAPAWPTKLRWTEIHSHQYYTAQFDGISSAKEKNSPAADIAAIVDTLDSKYHMQGVALGADQTIARCVELLAGSAFFVGCDSGMSHLAHCVGVPTFILRDGPWQVITTHRNKPYIGCHDAADFIDHKLPAWANYRTFVGPGL